MTIQALRAESLLDFLQALRESGSHLVAPVAEDGLRVFREVEHIEDIVLAEGNTKWSFKEFLFPRTEPLFHFRHQADKVELTDPELPEGETVIFGARPCDAASLEVFDQVFSWDYDDPFYLRRRAQTTIIGLSCAEPRPECFCTAVGLSPTGTKGSDLLLTRLGDEYLAEAVTEKGERCLESHPDFFHPPSPSLTEGEGSKEAATQAAEARIRRPAPIVVDDQAPLLEVFEQPFWEDMARRCLQCGVCAFVCPTCHCFDIEDESNAWGGSRRKNWDSCSFALFTVHTSGHNPRATQPARYRQRVLHKFRYIPERFGAKGCVGCGRCTVACPVHIDIYEVASHLRGEA